MSVGREGSSLSDSLCSDQRQRWLAGERVLVEDYVERYPELRSDPEALFEIIAGEFHLREEFGEFPDVSEYALRFPELSDRLQRLASTGRDASDVHGLETRVMGPRVPAGLHCRFCGRISRPTELSEAGEVRCEHCQKVLMVVQETTPYELTSIAVIGRFELREHLGRGQFGDVWRAYDADLHREVAVKIPRRMPENKAMHALFAREARAAARLRHPHIVPVHEIGKAGERIYIVSEFIKGTTLKKWLEQRSFTPREAAEVCVTIARAVHYAHQEGIVHRDLKPGNILMDLAGQPHIADFGLAKQSGVDATITVEGQVLGTPAYMSPEQARGEAHRADRRCDVYSLGVILYELLAGQRPFQARDEVLIYEILHIEPPPPRSINRAAPSDLETICLKAMAKEAAGRYATAEDFAADLTRFLNGEPILARRPSLLRRAQAWMRRRRGPLLSGAFCGAAALFTGALLASRVGPPIEELPYRHVAIETEPAGAEVHLIPLDDATGEPDGTRIIHCHDRSPLQIDLAPADYLVVAVVEGHGFHEVQRHVPDATETIPFAYNHRVWRVDSEDTVYLPKIKIPTADVTKGMALIEGDAHFLSGLPKSGVSPQIERNISTFYVDPREFTLADYKRAAHGKPPVRMRDNPPPDDHPLCEQDYDLAVYWSEVAGKRLLTEFEYEFAATARGKHRFPWGDDVPAHEANAATIQGVYFDRLDVVPPVVGLCSGPAEWTDSRPAATSGFTRPDGHKDSFDRIVRGGILPVLGGEMTVDAELREPRRKVFAMRGKRMPGLAFRCARSLKPRIAAEDFPPVSRPKPLVSVVKP